MDPLMALAKKHSLAIIEDAAESHGALYKGQVSADSGLLRRFANAYNQFALRSQFVRISTKRNERFQLMLALNLLTKYKCSFNSC